MNDHQRFVNQDAYSNTILWTIRCSPTPVRLIDLEQAAEESSTFTVDQLYRELRFLSNTRLIIPIELSETEVGFIYNPAVELVLDSSHLVLEDVDLEQAKRDAQASLAVHKDVHTAETPDEYIENTDNPAYSELGDFEKLLVEKMRF